MDINLVDFAPKNGFSADSSMEQATTLYSLSKIQIISSSTTPAATMKCINSATGPDSVWEVACTVVVSPCGSATIFLEAVPQPPNASIMRHLLHLRIMSVSI